MDSLYQIRSLSPIFSLHHGFFLFQNVPHGRIPCQLEGQPRNSRLSAASESLPPAPGPPAPAGSYPFHLLSAPALPRAPALRPGDAFPLLQLQPEQAFQPFAFPAERAPRVPPRCLPPPREAWGPPGSCQPPVPPRAMHTSVPPGPWAAEQKKGAGSGVAEVPKPLNLGQCVGQHSVAPQQGSWAVPEPEGVSDVKPGPLESPRYPFGFPLLHLQPRPAFTFFSVSRAPVAVPSASVRATGERTHPGFSFLCPHPWQESTVMTWQGAQWAALSFTL